MSYSTSKYVYPSSKEGSVFSGGITNNTPETHLSNARTVYSKNFRLDGASVINRPWHKTFKTVSGTDYPRGIGSYLRNSSANDVMVVRQNVDATHKLVTLTEGGTETSIVTNSDITVDTRMNFVNVGDVIYCMNGTDIGQLSGTTYTDIKTSSGLAGLSLNAPSFGVIWGNCHWVGGFSSSGQTVRKSVVDDFDNFSGSWSQSLNFPEIVTGLGVANITLFTFTKNTIHATTAQDVQDNGTNLTFDSKSIQATEGATCHASIVSVGSEMYYLSTSNKICKIARGANVYGFEIIELSDRKYEGISTFMNNLAQDQSDSFAQYYPEQNIIKWFMKSNWSTINDTCIVYDTEKDQFLLDTNKYFYDATYFKGQVYSISTITPTVFKDEYGADDDGSGIDFDFYTKAFDEGDYTQRKWYWESRTDVDISPLAELTQEIYVNATMSYDGTLSGQLVDSKTIDDDNINDEGGIGTETVWTFPIGTEGLTSVEMYQVSLIRTKWNLNVRGYNILFRYYNTVAGSKVRLKRLAYRMEVLNQLTTALTT